MIRCPRCNGDGCEPGTLEKFSMGHGLSSYEKCIICALCDGDGVVEMDKIKQTANERQEGGEHYRKVPGEQHWDRLVRLYGLDVAYVYFVGNITAYVERYRTKNGIEDLKKARHYIDKLIELEETHKAASSTLEKQFVDAVVKTYGRVGEEYKDIQERLVEESLKTLDEGLGI